MNKVNLVPTLTAPFPLILRSNLFVTFEAASEAIFLLIQALKHL